MTTRERGMKGYWGVFRLAYGEPPFECYGCGKTIGRFYSSRSLDPSAPVIHHVDGDHDNNEWENLAPMHRGCHTSLHIRSVMASRTYEEKAEVGRRGAEVWLRKTTPEQWRANGLKSWETALANETPEERHARLSAAGQKGAAAMLAKSTSEERSANGRKAAAASLAKARSDPEKYRQSRVRAARKAWETRRQTTTPEAISAKLQEVAARRSMAERRAISLKAWETRRRNAAS